MQRMRLRDDEKAMLDGERGAARRKAMDLLVRYAEALGCDEFVDVVCDRALDCLSSPGSHSECVQQVQQLVPCGSAKEVSASYDRCMDQVESNSCAVLFPTDPDTGEPALSLPADCNSVILVREASPSGGPDGVLSNVMRAHELAE